MLGSALTDLLRSLAEVPPNKRTPKQKALFEELALLCAASAALKGDAQHVALRAQLISRFKIEDLAPFSVTRPKPKGGARKCPCCGQPLPAPTSSTEDVKFLTRGLF
jgi:hypothetical protein